MSVIFTSTPPTSRAGMEQIANIGNRKRKRKASTGSISSNIITSGLFVMLVM